MRQIGVIGSGFLDDESIYKIAYDIGRAIADNNFILICSGKGGVMEAACKGCNDADGISVAILPSIMNNVTNIQTFTIGGTGILIIVSVVLETIKNIEAQLVMRNYEGYQK